MLDDSRLCFGSDAPRGFTHHHQPGSALDSLRRVRVALVLVLATAALGSGCTRRSSYVTTRQIGGESVRGEFISPAAYEAFLRGEMALANSDYDAAIREFRRAQLRSSDGLILGRLAIAYARSGNIALAEQLLREEPYGAGEAHVHLASAEIAWAQNQREQAFRALARAELTGHCRRCATLSAAWSDAAAASTASLSHRLRERRSMPDQSIEIAELELEAGRFEEARRSLRAANLGAFPLRSASALLGVDAYGEAATFAAIARDSAERSGLEGAAREASLVLERAHIGLEVERLQEDSAEESDGGLLQRIAASCDTARLTVQEMGLGALAEELRNGCEDAR